MDDMGDVPLARCSCGTLTLRYIAVYCGILRHVPVKTTTCRAAPQRNATHLIRCERAFTQSRGAVGG